LPLVIVYVFGLVLALLQMQRLPRMATAAGGGFALLLLLMLVRPLFDSLVYGIFGSDGQAISVTMTIVSFFFSVLEAVASGAIVYAIFVERPEVQLPIGGPPRPSQQPWNPAVRN
jgi:hypothetical protein